MLSHIIGPFPKKKVSPSEKVKLSEEVEEGTKMLYDIKYPVFTICKNNCINFRFSLQDQKFGLILIVSG